MKKQSMPSFAVAVILLAAILAIVYFASVLTQTTERVNNFDECAAAGNPVMETYPAQCNTPDGRHFVQEIPPEDRWKVVPPAENCRNLCGDGVCQEIVCMAIGCPCAETVSSCPQDCSRD